MKNILIVAAIAAIPAFAATGPDQPGYYQRPAVTLASEGAHFTRNDDSQLAPSYQPGSQNLAPSDGIANDGSGTRLDGNRNSELFQDGRR